MLSQFVPMPRHRERDPPAPPKCPAIRSPFVVIPTPARPDEAWKRS